MNANARASHAEEQLARDLATVEKLARARPISITQADLDELPEFADSPSYEIGQPWGDAQSPDTDKANANRIVYHLGDRLMFVDGIGWHVWGPPWQYDKHGAFRLAQGLSKFIALEAATLAPWVSDASGAEMKQRQEVLARRYRWAFATESKHRLDECLAMAESLLTCKAESLDANPMLLGLPNGVLELDTGVHREHRHEDLITKVAGAAYDPNAKAPIWEKFVSEIMGGDEELISFLQQLAGYALSGARGEHLLPILWGSGANGKSTFLGALQHVLGDYATSAAPGLLIRQGGTEHPTAQADLQGQRLVIVSESGEMGRLNEEQIKAMTGGDRIRARKMRQDFFEFTPTHLLFLQTNHRPKVTGTDEGIWRRLRLIPFEVTVPAERRDAKLPDKLKREAAGILAWAYRGLKKYHATGKLPTPEKVRVATAEYRDVSDTVGAFLEECTTAGDGFSCSIAALFDAHVRWCDENGERPLAKKDLGARLDDRGFKSFKSGESRKRRGLRLNEQNEERQYDRYGNR